MSGHLLAPEPLPRRLLIADHPNEPPDISEMPVSGQRDRFRESVASSDSPRRGVHVWDDVSELTGLPHDTTSSAR